MHITYTLLAIVIVGVYQLLGLITGSILDDILRLFPVLILSHLVDIIPSGVPRKKNMAIYMIYSTAISLATCYVMSYSINISIVTILVAAVVVGWFDYLLWIFRILKRFGVFFAKTERTLNWINIKILHPYIIKNNGHHLAHLRGTELDEEFEGKQYRSLSYEIAGFNKDLYLAISFLFLKHQSGEDAVFLSAALFAVFFFIWFICKERIKIVR